VALWRSYELMEQRSIRDMEVTQAMCQRFFSADEVVTKQKLVR